MPILGKTDRNSAPRRWISLGTIRKGTKDADGTPIDLDYFRFVPEKGPNADALQSIWNEAYGAEPDKIEILLPFQTVEENWQTWLEAYGKTGLKFRCNGKYWVRWLKDDLSYVSDYATAQQKLCPYCSGEQERTKDDPGDSEVGYLTAILIPFFENGYTGTVTITTTSINDIMSITGSLFAVEDQAKTRGDGLRGIPFNLMRVDQEISQRYQDKQGVYHKTRGEKSMVHLMVDPRWALQQQIANRQDAFSSLASTPAMLTVDAEEMTAIDVIDGAIAEIPMPTEPEMPPEPETPQSQAPKPAQKPVQHKTTAAVSRKPGSPERVMGQIRKQIESQRGNKFEFSGQDRHKAEWKIQKTLEDVAGNEMDTHLFLQFTIDETSFDSMDDAEIDTLKRYFKTTKDDSGNWNLDAAVAQEIRDIIKLQREVTGQKPLFDPDEEEPEEEESETDWEHMPLGDKRKYAEALFAQAKKLKLNPPSFTDETLDVAIVAIMAMVDQAEA